ncbi:MAG: GYF domain-containing protein, partial [Pirellulaceae bacterium]|nr:GYF domain-containing protein [Pirellulaceae bacterium]
MPDDHKWYYEKQEAFLGPIDAETMRDIIRSGGLTGATLVWRDGIIGRQPIANIPELAACLPDSSAAEGHVSASATPGAVQPVTVAHARTSPPASGLAISSLVLGILSLALFCLVPISLACGIIGLALGLVANKGSYKQPMAIAGIVTSSVGVVLAGLLILGIAGENREKEKGAGLRTFSMNKMTAARMR